MIHKQILDAASAHPDASFEELAKNVSGASVDLVERVLDQYGDPTAPEEPPENSRSDASEMQPMSNQEPLPEPEELTEEQRVVLEAVRRWPDATQSELAEQVGVSASTVNRRLHKIDGFQWADRHRYARELISGDPDSDGPTAATDSGPDGPMAMASDSAHTTPTGSVADPESNGTDPGPDPGDTGQSGSRPRPDPSPAPDPEPEPEREPGTGSESQSASGSASESGMGSAEAVGIRDRLDRLERTVQGATAVDAGTVPFGDSGLAAKVIRACLASDTITEEEELRIIEAVMTGRNRE
jgi:hypothetical protein